MPGGLAPKLSSIKCVIQHPPCDGLFEWISVAVWPPTLPDGGLLIALSCAGSGPCLRAPCAPLWACWTSRVLAGSGPLPPSGHPMPPLRA
eukprot:182120-Pyramimonas_sp.AAC.1